MMTGIAEGWLLLAAAALTLAGSVVRGGRWWRHALILAGAAGLADALLMHRGAVAIALALLLLLANLAALFRMSGGRGALDEETRLLRERHLASLSPGQVRLLMDQGSFAEARAGECLTREGEPVDNLSLLVTGMAAAEVGGILVGRMLPGDLIGEACLLPEGRASATVSMAEAGRIWFIPRARLSAFLAAQPEIGRALNAATMSALRDKLAAANRNRAAS